MLGNLVVWAANKEDLILKLQHILKFPDFCGQESPDTGRLIFLLKERFNNNVRFVIEFPYVDRHYRDTYYSFYSSKFIKTARNCIRVHLFDGEVTIADLSNKENNLNKRYWGFFIIRPLLHSILGRSLISPKAFIKNEYVCCLTKARVSLLGNELTAYGFPHIAQDKETHTCAESALWSYIEYFGSKYSQYKPLLLSQIIKTLLDNAEHRILPSRGLTKDELAKCLQNNGFQCLIYSFTNLTIGITMHYRLIQIYIESGIPYSDPELKKMVIKRFIAPLPVHMFLVAEKAYGMMEKIFNTKIVGLKENGEKWITRLFLTGSRSFKDFLFKTEDKLEPVLKNRLLSLPLPKFIWITEIYKAREYRKNGYSSGILIIDATSNGTLPASVLWYVVDNNMFLHDNVNWDEKPKRIVPFRMKIYRNNLKGEWSEWKS